MPINLKVKRLKVLDDAEARLHKAMDNWWDASILEWAEAAQSRIHVDTGMAASSLVPLMDDVGGAGRGHLITGHRSRIGYTDIAGRWNPGVTKDANLGRQIGGDYIIKRGEKYDFSYKTRVYQWAFHERRWQAGVEASNDFNKRAVKMLRESNEHIRILRSLLEVV